MRASLFSFVGMAAVGLYAVGLVGQQSAPPTLSGAYTTQCSPCHGAEMTGGTAPGILAYIRYHTDAEATTQIRQSIPRCKCPTMLLDGSSLTRKSSPAPIPRWRHLVSPDGVTLLDSGARRVARGTRHRCGPNVSAALHDQRSPSRWPMARPGPAFCSA